MATERMKSEKKKKKHRINSIGWILNVNYNLLVRLDLLTEIFLSLNQWLAFFQVTEQKKFWFHSKTNLMSMNNLYRIWFVKANNKHLHAKRTLNIFTLKSIEYRSDFYRFNMSCIRVFGISKIQFRYYFRRWICLKWWFWQAPKFTVFRRVFFIFVFFFV